MSDLKTLENCVGDYPILWAFRYLHDVPIRKHTPDGDSEFSHTETREEEFHVVAINDTLARAAYDHKRPRPTYRLLGWQKLLVIDCSVVVYR